MANVNIAFKVTGNELSSYMDSVSKKGADLASNSLRAALEQKEAGKEQLSLLNRQIEALEKKNRLEGAATRNVLRERKQAAFDDNTDYYNRKRTSIFESDSLTDKQKAKRVRQADLDEREDQKRVKAEYHEAVYSQRETERTQKAILDVAREEVKVIKQTAQDNVKAIQRGDTSIQEVLENATTDREKVAARVAEEDLRVKEQPEKRAGILPHLLTADSINRAITTIGQLTQTQNGFDLIQPASNLTGQLIGTALGTAIGAFVTKSPSGAMAGAAIGSSLFGTAGDVIGGLQQREAISKENFLKAKYRYTASTGRDLDGAELKNMEGVGINATQMMQLQLDYARKRGYESDGGKTTRDALYLEKGFGIDQSTSALVIEMQRSSKEGNRDLANLLGGVIERGTTAGIFKKGDLTFLNEFTTKFTSLQKELLKNQTTVATGSTMDILTQFNRMGGMFDVKDNRSSGIISSINSSLANPASDNLKAMKYAVLRDNMPTGSGFFSMQEEGDKGLGSPFLLKGMMNWVDRIGGDDEAKMLNLSGMFPGVPKSAIRTLFNNRKSLKNFDQTELDTIGITEEQLRGKAETNTTSLEKNTAIVENGILAGQGVERMADAFVTAVKATLAGAVITLKDGNTITLGGAAISPVNATKSQKQKVIMDAMKMATEGMGIMPVAGIIK